MGLVVSCMKFSKIKCFEHWRTGHQQHPGGGGDTLNLLLWGCVAESLRLWTCSRQKEMNLGPCTRYSTRNPVPVASSVENKEQHMPTLDLDRK